MKNLNLMPALLLGGCLCLTATGCQRPAAESPAETKKPSAKTPDAKTKTAPVKVEANKAKAAPKSTTKETGHKTPIATLKDFPQDIAIYKGAKVIGVGKSEQGIVAGLETKDAPQKVMDYYQKQLAAQGWTNKSVTTTKQGGIMEAAKNKRRCFVTVGINPKRKLTTFSLMVQEPSKQ